MTTNPRSLSNLFRVASKLAAVCALATTVAVTAAAQTNTFPNSGNAGVGTMMPAVPFEVRGASVTARVTATGTSGANGKFQIWSADIASNPFAEMQLYAPTGAGSEYLRFNLSNSSGTILADILTINRLGNVGIGTASPPHKLTLAGGWFAADNGYGLAAKDSGGIARTVIYLDSTNAIQIGNASLTPNVVFNNSGVVGIGTTTPNSAYKLDVNGSINVSGNINAKYQDLAEWVASSEQLSAGTVVVLDTTKSNQVVSSTASYDSRVAGVISAQPGITLGEGGEGKVLVATTGRVPVKVDASRGPIQIGDLLVTSDVAGVAMKSEPVEFAGRKMHMPGTIIGKALEPLAKGKGEILVLLSLQ